MLKTFNKHIVEVHVKYDGGEDPEWLIHKIREGKMMQKSGDEWYLCQNSDEQTFPDIIKGFLHEDQEGFTTAIRIMCEEQVKMSDGSFNAKGYNS